MKKHVIILLCASLLFSCSPMKTAVGTTASTNAVQDTPEEAVIPQEPTIKPNAPIEGYSLVFSDEFDAPIDTAVWRYRTGTRLGGTNLAENVTVENGWLKINCIARSDGTLTSGGIISRDLFGYGYYETRCRIYAEGGGVHTSFWSMGGSGSTDQLPSSNTVFEIDGFEFDSNKPDAMQFNLNYKIGKTYGNITEKSIESVVGREVTVGYEWLPDRVNWYLDGEFVHSVLATDSPIHYAQQSVWLTALLNTEMSGKVETEKLPVASYFDYFRFFAKPLKDINVLGASEFEYNENDGFVNAVNLGDPLSWAEAGNKDASFILRASDSYGGNYVLCHSGNNKSFEVETLQKVRNIPNGNYSLIAYVKGNAISEISVKADTEHNYSITPSEEWTKIVIENIQVSGHTASVILHTAGAAMEQSFFDNVSLYCNEGASVNAALPFVPQSRANDVLGTLYYDVFSDNYSESDGWKSSSLMGQTNRSRYKLKVSASDFAKWSVMNPESGNVRLNVGIVANEKNPSAEMVATVTADGRQVHSVIIPAGTKESLLFDCGVFEAIGGEKLEIMLKCTRAGATLRSDCIVITPDSAVKMDEVVLLSCDSQRAYVFGERTAVNNNPPPIIKNGRILISSSLLSHAVGLDIHADVTENGISYSYADTIEALTGLNVSLIEDTYIIIGPYTISALQKAEIEYIKACFN